MIKNKNIALDAAIDIQKILGGGLITGGEIHYVGTSGTAAYAYMQSRVQSSMLHTTVDLAVGDCTADRGDYIIVLPGYAETVTSSSTTLDIAGITILCLGNGENVPTFTFSTAAATINVSADDIKWIGGYFIGNYDNVASAFTVGAAKSFALEGGTFEDSSAALHFLSIVTTTTTDNAADGLTVKGNYWYGLALAPLAFISVLGDTIHLDVSDNFCDMAATNDVGHFITFAAKDSIGTRIVDNTLIVVGATNATVGIFLTGSGTGMTGIVSGNKVASLDTTTELIATAGTVLKFFENYYTGTADKSGKLWPVVDAE